MIGAAAAQDPAPRPNIVVFLSDDMGWGQPGFNGGTKVPTPNIDRIAQEGVKLTQFYVQPSCAQTRAALLTGRYSWKNGMPSRPGVNEDEGLPPDERTIAEALRDAGYATWILGKWHLGHWQRIHLPLQRGFDHHYGQYGGLIGAFGHGKGGVHDWHRNGVPVVEEGYSSFLIAKEAAALIGRHDGASPFFLYVAFDAVHGPHYAPDDYLAKYGKPSGGRSQHAQLDAMDVALGQVLDALEAKDLLDESLVMFLNDNGAPEEGSNSPYRGKKGSFHEGGVRVPAAVRWPGRIPAGSASDEMLHAVDLFPTFAGLAGAGTDSGLPLDGLDAWDTIANGAASPREEIVFKPLAIRLGDWKLIQNHADSSRKRLNPRLFNISEDPFEATNLAKDRPDKVEELQARLATHRPLAREKAPGKRIPKSAVVYGEDENAAFGAKVRKARARRDRGNVGPVLERLEAVDDRVALVFDEPVDTDFVPAPDAFRVVAPPSYAAVEVAGVDAVGSEVALRLASRLGPGTTVGLTYDVPDNDAIRDAGGLEAVGITWRTATVTSVDPVWRSTVTVEERDGYRGYSWIAIPDQGAVADHAFNYGEGAAYEVQALLAHSDSVVFQVRGRGDAISHLVLEWAGEILPLAEAAWDAHWDRYIWDQAWLEANAPSLAASAYAATLPDGSTAAVCLRFAEQACPPETSDDATLSLLMLSGIDIGTFAAGTASYAATVGQDFSTTRVTATANDANADVTIADAEGSTTGTSRTVALADGANVITVTVTAEDGTTTATYTVTVTREGAAVTPATPLTASFGSAPALHDGSTAFTVRLSFSEALPQASELQIRRALSVARGAAKTIQWVESRLDLWEVQVKPAGTDAVTMSLASMGSCGDVAAVCTADGRALSNAPSVTVEGPETDAPLTASFTSVPAEHDGSSTFIVHLKFSDDITTGYRPLRDQALSATDGTVRRARRINHRNDLWEIHVEPSGSGDVTVTLDPDTDDCSETGSVCTSDGRALSNTPSVTVPGPSPASATANGPLVILKWGSPRDGFGSPSPSDYGVRVNGRARAVVSAELAGTTARLRLASPAAPGDAVTVAYLGSAMHPLADAAGQVRSGPWDGLVVKNLTGTGRFRVPVPTAGSRPADPLAAASEDAVRLDASGLGLAEVWGVARLTALERLDLSGNAVSDLSPLAGLANLRDLDLSGNQATDLWPLSGLHVLERLDLSGNAVTDVQALAGLANLKVLLLDGNAVADLGPLTHLAALENLGLAGNWVGDLAALQDLPRLRRLDLSGNPAADLSPLGDVGPLVWLALPGRRVAASAGTLGRLTELRWVWLGSAEAPRADVPGLR